MRRSTDGGAAVDLFYHTDDMFNVMFITDSLGVIVERYGYGEFGDPFLVDANGAPIVDLLTGVRERESAFGNPYFFQGRRYDPETGFYYYRNRYFDPLSGRFTTRDPIGIWGDPMNAGNGYTFTGNNPWSYLDPYGLMGQKKKGALDILLELMWDGYYWATRDDVVLTQHATNVRQGGNRSTLANRKSAWSPGGSIPNAFNDTAVVLEAAAIEAAMAPVGGAVAKVGLAAGAAATRLLKSKADEICTLIARGFRAADGQLDEAFHYTAREAAEAISELGLKSGQYATPNGTLMPYQAQLDLALPPWKGPPTMKVRIDLDGMRRAGYKIPTPTRIGRSWNMPGGDWEIQFPYEIPPEFIEILPIGG